MTKIAQRSIDFDLNEWEVGDLPEPSGTAVKAVVERSVRSLLDDVQSHVAKNLVTEVVRDNLNTLIEHLDIELDATFEPDGTTASDGDLTIFVDYRHPGPHSYADSIVGGSMKRTIDAMVSKMIGDDDDSEDKARAALNMLAVSDYLREQAERLKTVASEPPAETP